jgi:hypothetical protein
MNGRYEMQHLMMHQVKTMKNVLGTSYLLEFLDVCLIKAPRLRQLVLDPFESPQEVKYLFVVVHNLLCEYSGQRGQVVDSIVKHEYLPALISRGGLQQLYIQP